MGIAKGLLPIIAGGLLVYGIHSQAPKNVSPEITTHYQTRQELQKYAKHRPLLDSLRQAIITEGFREGQVDSLFYSKAFEPDPVSLKRYEKWYAPDTTSTRSSSIQKNQLSLEERANNYWNSHGMILVRMKLDDYIKENYEILDSVEKEFEVPKEALASIKGMETRYGEVLGEHKLLETWLARYKSAATHNRRGPQRQVLRQISAALRFADKNNLDITQLGELPSSWAAAVGINQMLFTMIEKMSDAKTYDELFDPATGLRATARYLRHNWNDGTRMNWNPRRNHEELRLGYGNALAFRAYNKWDVYEQNTIWLTQKAKIITAELEKNREPLRHTARDQHTTAPAPHDLQAVTD